MARIPLYQSKEQLTTVAPQQVRESPEAAGQMGRNLQVAGNAITEANEGIRKAYDFQQVGTAKLKVYEGVNAIKQRALEDGENTSDLTTYDSDLARLKSDTLKGIFNPSVRNQFEMDLDLQIAQTRTEIKSMMWTRVKEKSIANMNATIDILSNQYAEGDDTALDAMGKNIDTYVKGGIIGADDAETIKTSAILKAKETAFTFDIENNPAEAEKKLKSNAYGFDVEKLAAANDTFDREINRIQNENEENVLDNYLGGGLTIDRVKLLRSEKKIDANFALEMIGKIKNGNSNKTNPIVYMTAVDTLIAPGLTGKEKRAYLLNLLNTQQLSDSDFKSLYETGRAGGASVATQYMSEIMTEEEALQAASKTPSNMNWLQSAVGVIKNALPAIGGVNVASAVMKLMESVTTDNLSGSGIPERAKSILKDIVVSQYPQVGLMKDLPNKIYDGKSVKSIYSGDNELTPTKQYNEDNKDLAIGDIVPVGKVDYRVVGLDSDGEPLVESE